MINKSFILLAIVFLTIGTACAQELTSAKASASFDDDGATLTSNGNTLKIDTLIDGVKFAPAATSRDGSKVSLSSGEKDFLIFDNPRILQEYTLTEDRLEDVIRLKEPASLSYRLDGTLSLQDDGSVKIDVGSDEMYFEMQPAVGTDSNGQGIRFKYEIEKDTVRVIVPKEGDDGKPITYPLLVDPVIVPRHYLTLLLHNNIEAADGFSTTTLRDSSKYGNMPSFVGTATLFNLNTTNALYGNASGFVRDGAYINVPDSDNYNLAGNNFTLCVNALWGGTPRGLSLFNQTQSSSVYQKLYIDSGSAVYWTANNGAGGTESATYTLSGGYALASGIWYQFCAIRNGSSVNLTVNGSSVGTGASAVTKANVAAPVIIGQNFSTAGNYIKIDEVQLFNGAALPIGTSLMQEWPLYSNATPNYGYADDNSTVALMHFEGSDGSQFFRDEVGNRTWSAAGGAVLATNASKFDGSSLFTVGSGRYITTSTSTVPFNYGSGDFTEEIWFNASSYPAAAGYLWSHINSSAGVANNQSYARLTSAGRIRYGIADNGAAETLTITSDASQPAPLNVWNHLVIVRNGTSVKMYLNGSETASGTYSGNMPLSNYLVTVGGTPLSGTYSFNGWLDEFRATSGYARWTSDFTPPSTPYGITSPSFSMNISESGTVPVAVQFNSTTPDDAWTQNGWYWTFGDGSTSTEQNPVHTYTTAGSYSVTLQTFNNNMTAITDAVTFTPGKPVISIYADPSSGTAALYSDIYINVQNTTPITSWGFEYSESAGYYSSDTEAPTLVSGSGTSTVWKKPHVFSQYGYWNTMTNVSNSYGTDTDFTQVRVSSDQSQQNTWYTPHEVQITVLDSKLNPVPGAAINCSVITSTLPDGWLTDLFGFQPSVSDVIENKTLNMVGTTDTLGKISFTMVSSVGYNLSTYNPYNGITYSNILYPSDTRYTITLIGATTNNTYQDMGVNTTLWMSEPNSSYGTMNLNYTDISGRTNNVSFWVIAKVNNTVIYSDFVTNPGTSTVLMNKTIQNVKGTAYTFGYVANRTV